MKYNKSDFVIGLIAFDFEGLLVSKITWKVKRDFIQNKLLNRKRDIDLTFSGQPLLRNNEHMQCNLGVRDTVRSSGHSGAEVGWASVPDATWTPP